VGGGGVTVLPGTVWPLIVLVAPVLLEQFLALAVGFVDKWLAGNLFTDAEPLAAIGLVAYCLAFMPVLFVMPAAAATALVSRAVGAGDEAAARRAATACLIVAVSLAGVSLVVATLGGTWFVGLLGLPAGSSSLAVRYLVIVTPTLPLLAVIAVGVASLRGAGDMVAGLVAMSVVNLVNAAASFVLATGQLGLPRLGWEGLAWGTVVGYACGAVVVMVLLARPARGLRPRRPDWRPRRESLGQIARIGGPAGTDAIGNAACHLAFLGIVNRLGDLDAAAHSVAITIESLAFLPGSAFGVAAATLAGQFLGSGDERRARRSVGLAAVTAAVLMTLAGLGFLAASKPLADWFTGGGGQPKVAALAASLVRIVAFAQLPLALLMVFAGGMRGAGATRPPLIVNFAGLILIRLPLAVFLAWPPSDVPGGLGTFPGCGLGVYGAWLAMAADLAARGLAMLVLYLQGGWSRAVV
jgi:putative MATE family efflux protein